MSAKPRADREVDRDLDDLLRRALADDLPADVEAGLRERAARVRAGAERPAWSARLSPRAAWAVLSVLALVAGFLLQGSGTGSPLAERFAAVKAGFATIDTTRR